MKNKYWLFLKKTFSFIGPGFLVAVGYMDPGNWATDLSGGSKFGYALLSVVLLSSISAMVLQYLSLKMGIVTGRDLAQMCRDNFGRKTSIFFWLMAEIMIIACDLAEVLGSAIALNLLFGIPIMVGVVITAFDVFLLLLLQNKGWRYIEALVFVLIMTVLVAFSFEIFFSSPDFGQVMFGFVPSYKILTDKEMLFLAVGILGATVMPHNLYLHSAVVKKYNTAPTEAAKKEAIRFSAFDSAVALTLAFYVNAAILIVAAATFYVRGVGEVSDIARAHELLSPLLGATSASFLFALALLASGQNSTLTGTLAGQIIMEGFVNIKIAPWARRIITRIFAIVPAVAVLFFMGVEALPRLLILSQVILSLQLPFAVFPLVYFTSRKKYLGGFANSRLLTLISSLIAVIIVVLNVILLYLLF